MKKQPKRIKHWAKETYGALIVAWDMFGEENPNPSEEDKLDIVRFAPAIAGLNRGISDEKTIKNTYSFIYDRTIEDLKRKDDDEPNNCSILFLLSYLDSHISFGILSEKKVDEIMDYLCENYDIHYEP